MFLPFIARGKGVRYPLGSLMIRTNLYVPVVTVDGTVKLSIVVVAVDWGRKSLRLNEEVPDHTAALAELRSSYMTVHFS